MKVRDQEITIPTSMVGNYPNPRWWDSDYARHFTGDQQPPDAMQREALEDAVVIRDQELPASISSRTARPHDNYADTAPTTTTPGYDLKGVPRLPDLLSAPRQHADPRSLPAGRDHDRAGAGAERTSKPTKIRTRASRARAGDQRPLLQVRRDRAMDIAKAQRRSSVRRDGIDRPARRVHVAVDWAIEALTGRRGTRSSSTCAGQLGAPRTTWMRRRGGEIFDLIKRVGAAPRRRGRRRPTGDVRRPDPSCRRLDDGLDV